jgi:hypothetical protein
MTIYPIPTLALPLKGREKRQIRIPAENMPDDE